MKLVQMFHGSHLYGTASAASDVDYKGVSLPSLRDALLGRIPSVMENIAPSKGAGEKNQPGDVDLQVFSLHHFIKMALKGETVAVDMLHAPRDKCQVWTDAWEYLRDNRCRFYTRNMTSLVDYARAQAAKYGLRGSRLAAAKEVTRALHKCLPDRPLKYCIDALPVGEHIRWRSPHPKDNGLRLYEVCGMSFQETAKTTYVASRLQVFIDRYGERAKLAEKNQGVDWKAISHAFRAAYQLRAIVRDGGFDYPLRETQLIVEIKNGVHPYSVAGVWLEDLLDEVEGLTNASTLPLKPDVEWAEAFVLDEMAGNRQKEIA